ncbi:hypothetical protein D5086_001828 [Populus alba]|uniref:Uncharacterized protein n=2 Tax=Populus TaxID=3689 RepID=A0ACC4CZT0_POPAL|nr:hypothetical protein POTOM_001606 [Populus tomentosa]
MWKYGQFTAAVDPLGYGSTNSMKERVASMLKDLAGFLESGRKKRRRSAIGAARGNHDCRRRGGSSSLLAAKTPDAFLGFL